MLFPEFELHVLERMKFDAFEVQDLTLEILVWRYLIES